MFAGYVRAVITVTPATQLDPQPFIIPGHTQCHCPTQAAAHLAYHVDFVAESSVRAHHQLNADSVVFLKTPSRLHPLVLTGDLGLLGRSDFLVHLATVCVVSFQLRREATQFACLSHNGHLA
jgi:hypothetical protein